jgi:Putative zinc-finger
LKDADRNSEPLDAILRQTMSETPGAATPECADAQTLAAYWDKSLASGERERLEAHLADCARCQTQMAAIARAEESARDAMAASRVPWYRRWQFAIPAMAAAAAVLVFIAIRRPTNEEPQTNPVVAMAKREAPLAPVANLPMPQPAPALAPSTAAPASPPTAPASNELAMNEVQREAAPRAQAHSAATARSVKRHVAGPAGVSEELKEAQGNAPASAPTEAGRVVAIAPAGPSVEVGSAGAAPPVTGSASNEVAITQSQVEAQQRAESKGYAATRSLSAQATVPNTAPMIAGGGGAAAIPGAAVGGTTLAAGSGAMVVTISPPDHSVTWIIGKNGMVERRDANGASHLQQSGVSTDLTAGAAPSASVCWIVGRSGTIIRTIDGGEHWTLIAPPITENLASISASNASDATISTASGQRFATTDGGASWHPQ